MMIQAPLAESVGIGKEAEGEGEHLKVLIQRVCYSLLFTVNLKVIVYMVSSLEKGVSRETNKALTSLVMCSRVSSLCLETVGCCVIRIEQVCDIHSSAIYI